MAKIEITRLDNLFDGIGSETPISVSDSGEVVGVIQELLRNHDLRKVPAAKHVTTTAVPSDPAADKFGEFGKYTRRAVAFFQKKHQLVTADPPTVDTLTLRRLVQANAAKPSVGRAYLTRRLDIADSVLCRVLTLIASWEENVREGGFRAWKPQDAADSPKTGLSYGILQWTHGSARLGTLLQKFGQLDALFTSCFGVAGTAKTEMINHAKAGSTVLKDNGDPITSNLDHLNFQSASLWKTKFMNAGQSRALQILQMDTALSDLRAIHTERKTQWTHITKQRGWGFMLDLANQRGSGGANAKYDAAVAALMPSPTESEILEHIENNESALHRPRRHFFRVDSPLPSDVDFPASP